MGGNKLELFALGASRAFGEAVAARLAVALAPHEERDFEDGEHKARPLVSVRGSDVFVIHSLYGDATQSANDKLVRLLFFIGALKDAAAARVTAVVPYLAYARKDRKSKSGDPVTTRYVAGLFEAVGTDRVVTLDVHNLAAFQNAFRCRTEHLEANSLFVAHFAPLLPDEESSSFRRTPAASSVPRRFAPVWRPRCIGRSPPPSPRNTGAAEWSAARRWSATWAARSRSSSTT